MADPIVPRLAPQSPGPGFRMLTFSDGGHVWMPPGATDADYNDATQRGEAQLARQYQAQAERENRPITAGSKVYSATGAYPAGVHGQLVAWLDHNAGGNALNRNATAQSIANAVGSTVGSASRIATGAVDAFPAAGLTDLTMSGLNVLKHLATRAAPSIANAPDFPTIVGQARSLAGTPPLPANASDAQRILESTASTMANPSQSLARAVFTNTGGYYGGKVGENVAGEPGQYLGSLLGAVGPDAAKQRAAAFVHSYFGGDQGPEVMRAAQDTGVQPTFGMVANPEGRRIEKFFGAVPIFGRPVAQAKQAADTGIRQAQIDTANQITGGPLPGQHTVGGSTTTNVTPATIGTQILQGARQGAANLANAATDEQQQLMSDIGPSSPGDIVHTILRSTDAGYPQKFVMDPGNYPSYEARLNDMRTMAIQQLTPEFQKIWGAVPAGTVPYMRLMQFRSRLGNELEGASGLDKGMKDQLYGAISDAMRDAAFAKGGQPLVDQFNDANASYQATMGKTGTVPQLEKLGGTPVGGYDQFRGPGGQTGPVFAGTFTGGKDEQGAFNYLTSNLNSPSDLALLSDPSKVPNSFWSSAAGQYYSTLGQTGENTFRPEKMATAWRGIDDEVKNQLFTEANAGPNSQAIDAANDAATLGENTVLPVERAGLTNVAGAAVLGTKSIDWLHALGQAAGLIGGTVSLGAPYGIAKAMENPGTVSTVATGPSRSLSDAIYSGLPAATQNIMQAQTNPYSPSF